MTHPRIVSLVPSLTETVCALGLRDSLVGCTTFCVEPHGLHRTVQMVGGTKDPDLEAIALLKPTHILVNEEENRLSDVEQLLKIAPTLSTFPKGPQDVPEMLRALGLFLAIPGPAELMAKAVEDSLHRVRTSLKTRERFVYFIWKNPWMVSGQDTYISRMLETFGFENAIGRNERYPIVSGVELQALHAERSIDHIFLATEPWPFRRRDLQELNDLWPNHPPVTRLDGQLLSWYGHMTLVAIDALWGWRHGAEPEAAVAARWS